MKIIFANVVGFLGIVILNANVYSFSVSTIEGQSQNLSSFTGKRVLIVTLPLTQSSSADSMLYSIDSLANVHQSELKVIGVPAFEDGFLVENRETLRTWYRSFMDTSVVIADGLKVRKTSGSLQHPLFNWLTNESQNEHFNLDAAAPYYKYFTNTEGKLVAVLKSQTKLSSASVSRALLAQ